MLHQNITKSTSYLLGALGNSASSQAEPAETLPEPRFSNEQLFRAATWWAQYLPGVREVVSSEVSDAGCMGSYEGVKDAIHTYIRDTSAVTKTQYDDFISTLITKMRSSEVIVEKMAYIQIGSDDYAPPSMIVEAMHQAGITEVDAYGLFPFKTEMKIYENGLIIQGTNVITTNRAIKHYGQDTDFSSAPYMKFSGDKFRIVTICLDNIAKLCESCFEGKKSIIRARALSEIANDFPLDQFSLTNLYTSLRLSHFKGTEEAFLRLTNDELVAMLQDEEKLKRFFDVDKMFFYYKNAKDKLTKNMCYESIGSAVIESLGGDYYQYTSEPVKVLSASQQGAVGYRLLRPVFPKDFIIRRDVLELGVLNKENNYQFIAKQCDEKGNVLVDTIYRPGEGLPVVSSMGLALRPKPY